MKYRIAAIAAAGLLASGCVTHRAGTAEVFAPEGVQPAGFDGILTAATDAKTRYVFITHGMGNTEPDFGDPLLNRLADAGYSRTWKGRADDGGWIPVPLTATYRVSGGALPCAEPSGLPCVFTSFGEYKIDSFRHASSGDVVHVYRFYWHAALLTVQAPFIENDNLVPRASLNGSLKEQVVNYGFTDAAGYLGPMGRLMREGAEGAVCAMMRDAAAGGPNDTRPDGSCAFADLPPETVPDNVALSFISMSLGSRLLIDTLVSAYDRDSTAAAALDGPTAKTRAMQASILRRSDGFYMLANQLPLLGVGCVRLERVGAAAAERGPCLNESFVSAVEESRIASSGVRTEGGQKLFWPDLPPLQIVSFQDPDDLLGFRFSDDFAKPASSKLKVVQVVHRNTPRRKFLRWSFANPLEAHATELEHLSSARLILCGGRLAEDGETLRPASDCLPPPMAREPGAWD